MDTIKKDNFGEEFKPASNLLLLDRSFPGCDDKDFFGKIMDIHCPFKFQLSTHDNQKNSDLKMSVSN